MALGKWPDENAALASPRKALVLGGDRVLIGVNVTLDQWNRWIPQDVTRASLIVQLTSSGGLSVQRASPTVPLNFTSSLTVYPSGGLYIGSSPSDPGANNLQVQGYLTVKGAYVNHPFVFEQWPSTDDVTSFARRYIFLGSTGNAHLLRNAYYDGAYWVRFDNTQAASRIVAGAGYVQFDVAPSGTGPISFTVGLSVLGSGGVYIGSSPSDPGAGSLTVENSLSVRGNVGFYGTAPQPRPTVTGSRGGNAALASLLSALASLGLITDSSTP